MKKHNFILAAAFVMLMLSGFKSKAQTFPFTNSLTCDVTLTHEIFYANCTLLCSSGAFVVPAGQTVNMPRCAIAGFEVCVNIDEIDYQPVTTLNHATLSQCHMITNYGQTGPLPASCGGGGTYTVTHTSTGWLIQ